jgi:hypothetical protein
MERRPVPRREVTISGVIFWDGGYQRRRCTVVNLSDLGGCAVLGAPALVPNKVFLLQESCSLVECDVKWQSENRIGLFFLDTVGREMRKTLLMRNPDLRPSGTAGNAPTVPKPIHALTRL